MKQVVMKWETEFVDAIDAAAKALGMTRTAWVLEAAQDKLAGKPRPVTPAITMVDEEQFRAEIRRLENELAKAKERPANTDAYKLPPLDRPPRPQRPASPTASGVHRQRTEHLKHLIPTETTTAPANPRLGAVPREAFCLHPQNRRVDGICTVRGCGQKVK